MPSRNPARIDDKSFMESPEKWPHWPLLPVKRPGKGKDCWPQLGLIIIDSVDESKPAPVVYLTSLYGDLKMKDAEKKEYPSIEALIADGWTVD